MSMSSAQWKEIEQLGARSVATGSISTRKILVHPNDAHKFESPEVDPSDDYMQPLVDPTWSDGMSIIEQLVNICRERNMYFAFLEKDKNTLLVLIKADADLVNQGIFKRDSSCKEKIVRTCVGAKLEREGLTEHGVDFEKLVEAFKQGLKE
jgi:hypothetical protein